MENIFERIREIRNMIAKDNLDALRIIEESLMGLSEESKDLFADYILENVNPKGNDVAYKALKMLRRGVDDLDLAKSMLNESKESMMNLLSSDILKGLSKKDRYEIMDKAIRLAILSKDMELICSARLTIGGMR